MKFPGLQLGVLQRTRVYREKIPLLMDEITIKFRKSTTGGDTRRESDQIAISSPLALNFFPTSSTDNKEKHEPNNKEKTNDPTAISYPDNRTLGFVCLGLFYGLVSGIFFCLCAATVKYLDSIDPGQVAFYQYIGICVFSMPMVVLNGKSLLGPDRECRGWILLCGVFDAVTVYLAFVSFRYLPLSDASVITSSVPVFVTITARIFLKELCGKAQIGAIVISVLGVALVTKVPLLLAHRTDVYTKENIIGIIASLGAVATESGVYVLLRKLHEVDVFIILFNFGWIATLVTGVLTAIFGDFTFATCSNQWLVIAVGAFSFLSQMTLTKALELEHAGPVSVLMSAGDVILAFILDVTIFDDHPDAYTISGTILVISSVIIVGFKKWFDELSSGLCFRKKVVELAH